jgi:hypothetical protein
MSKSTKSLIHVIKSHYGIQFGRRNNHQDRGGNIKMGFMLYIKGKAKYGPPGMKSFPN